MTEAITFLIGIGAMGEILSMILYDSFAEYRRRSCAASSLATVGALIGLASSIILVISGKIN